MRTKGKYTHNKGIYEYKLPSGETKRALFWFNYASPREKTFSQPFGQPIASSNDLIITDTQLPFKVNRHIEINGENKLIVNIKSTPLNEKTNKRIGRSRYIFMIEVT